MCVCVSKSKIKTLQLSCWWGRFVVSSFLASKRKHAANRLIKIWSTVSNLFLTIQCLNLLLTLWCVWKNPRQSFGTMVWHKKREKKTKYNNQKNYKLQSKIQLFEDHYLCLFPGSFVVPYSLVTQCAKVTFVCVFVLYIIPIWGGSEEVGVYFSLLLPFFNFLYCWCLKYVANIQLLL